MGYKLTLSCSACRTTTEYLLGCGRNDFDKEVVAGYFSNSSVKGILKLIKHFTYEAKLGKCSSCGKVNTYPSLKYMMGARTLSLADNCDCGGIYTCICDCEMIDSGKLPVFVCDRCNSNLSVDGIKLWD